MGGCSVPIKKVWFDERFKELCDWHDAEYKKRVWQDKVIADFVVTAEFAKRGYPLIAYGSIPYFHILGTAFWLYKKYTHEVLA